MSYLERIFRLSIRLENDCYQNEDGTINVHALATELRVIADKVEYSSNRGPVIDANGNNVGEYEVKIKIKE